MRKLILDTETTGLDYQNDRIIELACLELVENEYTERKFHQYYNPDGVVISEQSEEIHGLSNSFLRKFNSFDESLDDFIDFVGDAELVIHNAQFDISMINNALKRKNRPEIQMDRVFCTLEMAKKKFPGSKNNLNALCRRFNINLESREKHGALTDCFLLLRVFIELLGGKQEKLTFSVKPSSSEFSKDINYQNHEGTLISVSEEEILDHKNILSKIDNPIWNQ
ncbi:MAG: DNA polymerase III subunit epsilon [Alphaproteobacteria bacterium]|tara:strand:- start:109 stop:780 length:672 start_codon:yes stop_codon:yes gene_type:complete